MKNDLLLALLGALLAILVTGLAVPVSVSNATEEINPELIGGFVEGDIIVDSSRNIVASPFRMWPCRVPFYINCTEFTEAQVQAIKDAFALIASEVNLCIYQIYAPLSGQGYISINCDSPGCGAGVGYSMGPCRMNLEPNTPGVGCFRQGNIIHEILHVLGFFHEQTSPNRDKYVTVNGTNIQEGKEQLFTKQSYLESIKVCEPYDYGSIMHYGAFAFSKNGLPTLVPTDPNAVIGQRVGMSAVDICRLKYMYYYRCFFTSCQT